jgi:hypothetical protein
MTILVFISLLVQAHDNLKPFYDCEDYFPFVKRRTKASRSFNGGVPNQSVTEKLVTCPRKILGVMPIIKITTFYLVKCCY